MGMTKQIPVDGTTIWNQAYHLELQANIEKYFTGQQVEGFWIWSTDGDGNPLTATMTINGVEHGITWTWNSDGTLASYQITMLGPDNKTLSVSFSYDQWGNANFTCIVS